MACYTSPTCPTSQNYCTCTCTSAKTAAATPSFRLCATLSWVFQTEAGPCEKLLVLPFVRLSFWIVSAGRNPQTTGMSNARYLEQYTFGQHVYGYGDAHTQVAVHIDADIDGDSADGRLKTERQRRRRRRRRRRLCRRLVPSTGARTLASWWWSTWSRL